MTEKEQLIMEKLDSIAKTASELMNIAETGTDGNLEEMSYHIKCYSKKIEQHLLKTWRLNERVAQRRAEKAKQEKNG